MRRIWEVSRRACLRGTGAAIGLPFLEAMVPGVRRARAEGAPLATPLVFFVFNGGTPETTRVSDEGLPGSLRPATSGANYETTPMLQPFADLGLKQDITVVTNLHNSIGRVGKAPGDMGGDHPREEASLLTAVSPQYADEPRISAGISVDQLAANELKKYTPSLSSLIFQVQTQFSRADIPMSWSGPTSPRTMTTRVSDAFAQVFGDGAGDQTAAKKAIAYKNSVLHYVKDDTNRLRKKLGMADQAKLDQYLTSIEEIERQVMGAGTSGGQCGAGFKPDDSASFRDRLKQILDLVVLAIQCDRTRVVLLELAIHGMCFDWLGSPCSEYASWHDDIEHAGSSPNFGYTDLDARMKAYQMGSTWTIGQFGYLVRKLKDASEPDGTGSLLDTAALVCTSEFAYGNSHAPEHLPVIVSGRARGAIAPGRHLVVPNQPIANLWVAMLNAAGIDTTSFGNSTGALSLT